MKCCQLTDGTLLKRWQLIVLFFYSSGHEDKPVCSGVVPRFQSVVAVRWPSAGHNAQGQRYSTSARHSQQQPAGDALGGSVSRMCYEKTRGFR